MRYGRVRRASKDGWVEKENRMETHDKKRRGLGETSWIMEYHERKSRWRLGSDRTRTTGGTDYVKKGSDISNICAKVRSPMPLVFCCILEISVTPCLLEAIQDFKFSSSQFSFNYSFDGIQ